MEHGSTRAAFNCDDFPPAWNLHRETGGGVVGWQRESRIAIKIRRPSRTRRNDALRPFLSLDLSSFSLSRLRARSSARGNVEDEDRRPRGIYVRRALVECSFAAFAEGPGGEKRKRVKEGGESLVRGRDGRTRERRMRKGSAGRWGRSMKGPRGYRATLLENKAGILTLIYRSLPLCPHSPLVTESQSQPVAAPGSRTHPGEN